MLYWLVKGPYMLKQIGKSLQHARIARDLTQAELGALVGLPQSHISKIERGETDFQWTTLEQIANAVGLSAVLVPTGLVPVVESLMEGRKGKDEEKPVPLVGNLRETEG
jgi:transcriptional regulator with XRE-family HTH domain